jgi:hypothetical protein
MIYLLSWSGRGYVGFLLLIAAVLIGVGVGALLERGQLLCFGLSWLAAGLLCYVLGKRWNAADKVHKFCGLSLEKWGWIYCVIGAFFTLIGYQGLKVGM